jgi:hypothetical protein
LLLTGPTSVAGYGNQYIQGVLLIRMTLGAYAAAVTGMLFVG